MRVRKQWLQFFEKAVREMNYDSPVYKMLKRVLSERGYWKNRPRGNSSAEHFRGKRHDES